MSESELTRIPADSPQSPDNDFILQKFPYLLLLALTIIGVTFTSVTHTPLIRYWEILAVATGVMCVVTAWGDCENRSRWELIAKQAAHWGAIIVAMRIVLLPGIQTMFTAPATSYALLLLLALGTFLAGLNISLRLCMLGSAMALAVPAMLWLKQTALLSFLVAAAIIGVALIFWRR